MNDQTENPLARQLRDQRDAVDAASGESAIEKDFVANGKAQAPDQLKELRNLVQKYVDSYNSQRPTGVPQFMCQGNPPRFTCAAGFKFAATFEGITSLQDYKLRVNVGYHNAARAMHADLPEIQRSEWWYQAYSDDSGFWWRDQDGQYSNEVGKDRAMEALANLVSGS
jgi:hypothetical protein